MKVQAVDLAAWYLPDICEVFGMGYTSPNTLEVGIDSPDSVKFLFRSRGGQTATVSGNYASRILRTAEEQQITCTLRGTKGTTRAGYPKFAYYTDVKEIEPPKTEFRENVEAIEHRFDEKYEYYFRFGDLKYHAGEYQNYLEYFIDCIRNNKDAKPDLEEGINTIAIMDAMQESLDNNAVVKIEDIRERYNS